MAVWACTGLSLDLHMTSTDSRHCRHRTERTDYIGQNSPNSITKLRLMRPRSESGESAASWLLQLQLSQVTGNQLLSSSVTGSIIGPIVLSGDSCSSNVCRHQDWS